VSLTNRRQALLPLAAIALLACGGQAVAPATTPRAAVGVQEHASPTKAPGGTIHDVTYDSSGRTVSAYLLIPDGKGPFAAIEFAHWYTGRNGADRHEFVDEATGLLKLGVVSLLPQGQFPWREDPSGVEHDQAAIDAQVADFKAGIDVLLEQPAVDAARLAFVGHDYGAMHGALLIARDARIKGAVLMAGDPIWVTWFAAYWQFLKTDAEKAAYASRMGAYDPVNVLPTSKASILIQFGSSDVYISRAEADRFIAAVAGDKSVKFYTAGHELNALAMADRLTWLRSQLKLP
jgi:predicted esterase